MLTDKHVKYARKDYEQNCYLHIAYHSAVVTMLEHDDASGMNSFSISKGSIYVYVTT